MKVLIVDDDALVRALVKVQLQAYECDFFESATLEGAIHVLKKEQIHVVLLDINLEGGDGRDLLRGMKRRDFPTAPVIVMTFDARREIVQDAIELGARGFITKPLEHASLVERIEQIKELKPRREREKPVQSTSTPEKIRPLKLPRRILLVEPNEERRETILNLLQTTAWEVSYCETLHQAELLMDEIEVDYLFINIKIDEAGLDSKSLIARLLETGQENDLGVIALGRADDVDYLMDAHELGISDFILDPVTYAKLEKSAQTLVERASKI